MTSFGTQPSIRTQMRDDSANVVCTFVLGFGPRAPSGTEKVLSLLRQCC
jgi:hypothetical protein